jgi:type IV pilus assembly protein PilB
VISQEQLDQALAEKEETGERLGEIMLRHGWVAEEALARALAEQHGLEFIDLAMTPPNPTAVRLLPERYAYKYRAVPVRFLGSDSVLVAVADPTDVLASDVLKLAIGASVKLAVGATSAITTVLERVHGPAGAESDTTVTEIEHEPAGLKRSNLADVRLEGSSAPAVEFVNRVIKRAVEEHASDIHFEPWEDRLIVRARIDGVTRRIDEAPLELQQAVGARLKIMGDLDIAERRAPQDGRMSISFGGEPIDLRIAVLPTTNGEQVVLRILYRSSNVRDLTDLGMAPDHVEIFERALHQPYGCILVSGPTGSGKTTTLYAGLGQLNTEDRVVVTIEDPVEYQVEGMMQIDVNPKAGLTFATGLRTILRSDPDVLLVGEIRDGETATIAVQAAMTGHLVLSTIHANTAARSIARLKDMGIDVALIENTLNCIVAQRLARRLCASCKEPYESEDVVFRCDVADAPPIDVPTVTLYRGKGCAQCAGTGYAGRLAFYEILDFTGPLKAEIAGTTRDLQQAANAAGFRTLAHDGLRLAIEGKTSVEEVARITGGTVERRASAA